MSLKIRRLSYALGAEIIGLDIQKPLGDKTVADIRAAFLEHCVLLFRGQPLTREQHIAFSRQLGEVDPNKAIRAGSPAPEHSEIAIVANKNFGKPNANSSDAFYTGKYWHTDRSYSTIPTLATLLRGVAVPDVGGDTLFTNCYLAYDALSEGMKKLLDGLHGVHVRAERYLDRSSSEAMEETKRLTQTAQPLVRIHPETGRKALYLGEAHIKHIIGMTAEESAPLLQYLHRHATRLQYIYRHVWEKNDLVMWDNRCTMHNAVGDYDKQNQMRHMEKTHLVGTPSGYAYALQQH